MKLLPRHLRTETHRYFTEKSFEKFSDDLNEIFHKKRFDYSSRLTGEFTSKKDFVIARKIPLMLFRRNIYYMTRIYGSITLKNNETIIDIVIYPHNRVYRMLLVMITFCCVIFFMKFEQQEVFPYSNWILGTLIFLIVLTILNSQRAKNNLKRFFIKSLDLREKSCL